MPGQAGDRCGRDCRDRTEGGGRGGGVAVVKRREKPGAQPERTHIKERFRKARKGTRKSMARGGGPGDWSYWQLEA